ncbi:MAG TPA: fibronectin type III domain-containing protein [Chryseosolibacter sp.]|nr:fibronectin type III domain-containing protein [Chryseosolibacter sp.]
MRRNIIVSSSPLFRLLLCACSFFLYSITSFAQEYPVHVTTILPGPYSVYLSDYGAPESNFQLIINLRELDRTDYRVKLRLTIEGAGISIRTKPAYLPPPFVLNGGIPEMITGYDLRAYFHPDNLDFAGISRNEFLKTGKLPEGFYTFRIEVLDYVRSVVVSNASLANAWLVLNDPPIINLPFNNDKLVATDPQNIIFSWTPRHTASPNAAFNTEYEFTIVELWPATRNPNDAFLSSRPIFTTTTTQTSLNYGMTETLLIPGRKYAFRIHAYDISHRDLFRNNGYSEIFVFQYGDACVLPENFDAEALDPQRLRFSWNALDVHTSFLLQYRQQGAGDWDVSDVITDSKILPDLKGNTTYEYRMRATCGSITSDFSSVASVTTPERDDNEFVCGAEIPSFEIGTTPIPVLYPNDIIKTADFEVSITTLEENPDGTWKGEGIAFLPWLNLASVGVKFHNIRVNDEYRVYAGNITTIYTQGSKFVKKFDLNDDNDQGDAFVDGTVNSTEVITYEGDIETITADTATAMLTITIADGSTSSIEWPQSSNGEEKEVRVVDSNGDSWVIDKNGNVQEGPRSTAPDAIANAAEANFIVDFSPHENQVYGFDAHDENFIGITYDTVTLHNQIVNIPWKSLEKGQQDLVVATAGQSKFPTFVGFRSGETQLASQPSSDADTKKVFVIGTTPGTQSVSAYATIKDTTSGKETTLELGALQVQTYDRITNTVFIVPVNDVTISDGELQQINATLNDVYAQGIASWDTHRMPVFNTDPDLVSKLDEGESDIFAKFPENMQRFIRMYRTDHNLDPDAYYIFLVKCEGAKLAGFMPFKQQFGFIFANNLDDDLGRTIAHELGHGAFRLRHPFHEFTVQQGQAGNNVMDYPIGTNLRKYQWDNIHDPESMIGWLYEDEESEMKSMLTSKYVFMHDQLSTRSYASNVGVNEFTQEGVDYVDSKLHQLDTAAMKTYIYFAYIWFHSGNIDRFDQLVNKSFKHAIDSIKQNLNVKDFNLLAIVNAKYDTALSDGLKSVSFREQFFPISGLVLSALNQ